MRIRKPVVCALAGAVLVVQSGCGTLLHPERKGQGQGQLDPSVVILDGIGLFFFLIPGIIAFAVDLSNDTIYLPNGGGGAGDAVVDRGVGANPGAAGYRRVTLDGELDAMTLEALVQRELGFSSVLSDSRLEVRGASADEVLEVRRLVPSL